jgi:hypothetical protein
MGMFGQALDSCEFVGRPSGQQVTGEHSIQATPNHCLICAAAHSAPLVAPPSFFAPTIGSSGAVPPLSDYLRSALHIFALYVRPPPIF